MLITVTRIKQGTDSTLSTFAVDGKLRQYILEDKDRMLTSLMSLEQIKKIKVYEYTAIPTGKYRVILSYSNRFKRILPEVLKVPGYEGIRIHAGNYIGNTSGCLLPGKTYDKDKNGYYRVWDSRAIVEPLIKEIQKAIDNKEEVWIEIKRTY